MDHSEIATYIEVGSGEGPDLFGCSMLSHRYEHRREIFRMYDKEGQSLVGEVRALRLYWVQDLRFDLDWGLV